MIPIKSRVLASALAALMLLGGCAAPKQEQTQTDHYVSPKVEGANARINLEEVQKAFFNSKGSDFNGWMGAFEKRVNEIYDGAGVVSIDASRANNKLTVTGYIDKDSQPGFKSGDDKLFAIEQTGEAANNQVPIRVANGDGATYYQGHHSLLDNPFLQAFMIAGLMNSWGGRYHTSPRDMVVLRDHRDGYRQTPSYKTQQAENKQFSTRFKQKALTNSYESNRKFGTGGVSQTGTKSRSWSGSQTNSGSGSSWGGRRTTSDTSVSNESPKRSSWGSRPSAGSEAEHPRSFSSQRRSSSGYSSGFGSSSRRSWGGRRRR